MEGAEDAFSLPLDFQLLPTLNFRLFVGEQKTEVRVCFSF